MGFDFAEDFRPLAARLRPQNLDQYVGQNHLLADGLPLRQAIENGQLHSMILWGPPGTGKTTLAEIAAQHGNAEVEKVSAVTGGIKEVRAAIEQAKLNQEQGRRTVLFVDEVHRFNKSQQDAFLPHVEDGTIIFIGATTENPSFELNNALLSRARVYVLQALKDKDIVDLINDAIQRDSWLSELKVNASDEVIAQIASFSTGDARRALNTLEMMLQLMPQQPGSEHNLTLEHLKSVAGERYSHIDKQGDQYFDLLSALHKSIRGSNPDGALFWYARILEASGDPLVVARRCLAIASEDVGNADPRAMQVALSAWDCYTRVGAAEGERAIAQAVSYLACAPKSNAVYSAFSAAKGAAKEFGHLGVPVHLRNAPTALMKDLGYGQHYRYAHNEPNAYAIGQTYLPDELKGTQFYHPVERGLEIKISEKLKYLRQLDADFGQE